MTCFAASPRMPLGDDLHFVPFFSEISSCALVMRRNHYSFAAVVVLLTTFVFVIILQTNKVIVSNVISDRLLFSESLANWSSHIGAHVFASAVANTMNAPPCDTQVQPIEKAKHRLNLTEALYTIEGHHHLASLRLHPDGLAPLTQWAQSEIYRHQHPAHCTNVAYTPGWASGFGSEVHVIGTHLAYTIEHGQVLVWSPGACAMMTTEPCGASRCTCFFQELSNCSAENATTTVGANHPNLVPARFKAALLNVMPSITEAQIKYWWRAQSAAYIVRLNRETLEDIRRMRLDVGMHTFSQPGIREFPLPQGTINAHIRAGDKGREMRLVSAELYAKAAADLVVNNPFDFRARTLFVSSDAESAISECGAEIEGHGNWTYGNWTWIYSRIDRMQHGFQLGDGMRSVKFTRQSILQLLMSLEADGWIGTRGSNWCRLIDELRCVWVDKCNRPFVEVGDVPKNYDW